MVLDVGHFLRRSLRRWRLAAGIAAGLVLATAAATYLFAPKYACTTKIVLQGGNGGLAGNLGALASLAGVSDANGDPSAYFVDVVMSNDVALSILERPWKVRRAVEETSKPILLKDFWKVESDSSDANWKEALDRGLINRLHEKGYLEVDHNEKSGVFTLSTRFEDPLLTYQVIRFLVDRLNEIFVTKFSTSAGQNRRFIQERLVQVSKDLSSAEEHLRQFLENNRARIDPELQLREARLQRDVQINQEVYLQLVKQLELAKIDEAKDLPILEVIDQPLMPVSKVFPRRKLIILAAILFWGLIAFAFGGIWDIYVEDRKGFLSRSLTYLTKAMGNPGE